MLKDLEAILHGNPPKIQVDRDRLLIIDCEIPYLTEEEILQEEEDGLRDLFAQIKGDL